MLWRSCRTPREAEASGFGRTHLTGEPAAGGRHDRTLLARVGHRRELFKPLRRFGRTELLGTLVPQPGLANLAYVLREAELLEHVRIERAGSANAARTLPASAARRYRSRAEEGRGS